MAQTKKPRRKYVPGRVNPFGAAAKLVALQQEADAQDLRARLLADADPVNPAPEEKRERMLATLRSAMVTITQGKHPTEEEWRVLSDLVNMIETMEVRGNMDRADTTEHMTGAMKGMVLAANRYREGKAMRLDGEGVRHLSALLEIYAQTLEEFSERESLEIILETSDRVRAAQAGKTVPDRHVIML